MSKEGRQVDAKCSTSEKKVSKVILFVNFLKYYYTVILLIGPPVDFKWAWVVR